ncbi:alanine racemase [Solemya velesiana gill symbiont]|uniref:Alanine racemase n=1 Tax=Solemya velesiana gill symbiont TaxID=1918948 RepID=A0A1T2KW90_9GAMM|nr:alanine racemase [Solemya velesiana gill symbiont]
MGPRALIDLSALAHNLRRARSAAPASRVIAVVKSNGYGHGVLRAAKGLAEADAFAVARVSEGIELRSAGIDKPIMVLGGARTAQELSDGSDSNLELMVHHHSQVTLLENHDSARPVTCWLKVDSGMHRLGFLPGEAETVWQRLSELPSVQGEVRLVTHMANADDISDNATIAQLERFNPVAERLGVQTSIANSASTLGWPNAHGDWVRPGIMLYGASPFLNGSAEQDGLRPVMTLETRLMAVNHLPEGSSIGYGGTWCCPEAMPVGVAAIGYGDGYPRHAPSGTPVLVNGKRVPLVGRVSMDMITLDLRSQPDTEVGDTVTLWGEGLPADEIARAAGTIAYELFCGVTRRVRFEEVDGQEH